MIRIDLERKNAIFLPGELLTGVIILETGKNSSKDQIKVSLVWQTRGKGTVDRSAVVQTEVSPISAAAGASFSLKIPAEGPCSFSGILISLSWHVEAQLGKDKHTISTCPFLVSHTGKEIVLSQVGGSNLLSKFGKLR